jgi:hypothetical protein
VRHANRSRERSDGSNTPRRGLTYTPPEIPPPNHGQVGGAIDEDRRLILHGCSRPVERLLEITGVRVLF